MKTNVETLRRTESFELMKNNTRYFIRCLTKFTPRSVMITKTDADCLMMMKDETFDQAAMWDFGCGAFA